MLERIGALEPRIEHPVGIHEIRNTRAPQSTPGGQGVVLPEALNDDHVVLLRQGADAGGKFTPVAVAAGHRAKADGLKRLIPQPGGIGGIKAGCSGGDA